jgi:hypothetical protein
MSSENCMSSKFSVEFIWFISMLITNDAFLILSKLLVLSITQRWGIQLRCHTQSVWLEPILKAMQEKKRSHMYLKVKVDNDRSHWQQGWCNSPQFSNALILIDTVVVLIVQDDNEYIIVAYRTVSSMIMSLAVAATLTEMFWCMTFQKSVILMFLTVSTTVRNQHIWLWIRIALMYNDWWVLICCNVIQICTNRTLSLSRARMIIVWEKWAYKASCCWSTLRTELTSVSAWKQQHKCCTRQELYKLSAQRHILVWHLHDDSCCCCCCWACHTRVSAEIFNQERFHIQKMTVKKLKKKEKKFEKKDEGFITHFTDR